jgi:aryl-alcohol dehydrogenase-like predicted oxidoreductase
MLPTRRLGRTGHESSVAVLGAAAFAVGTEEATAAAFQRAVDAGVNHLDIAPRYGAAQRLVGPLIPAVRDQLFVGCKTGRHNRDGVRAQLEESLQLLHCDSFDLYQLHGVTDLDELERRADAMEAIVAARAEGLTRFVGITGHDMGAPRAHAEAVRRWDLDTVMFPVYPRLWADDGYRRDAEALLDLCEARDVGVMAIKAAAARPWSADGHRHSSTWYEPYTARDAVARGIRFALSTPGVHAFCTPGDASLLATAIDVVASPSFAPMDGRERQAAVDEVAAEPSIFPMPLRA